jgi:phage repressor protein C with HTH and peptisase S24 domain
MDGGHTPIKHNDIVLIDRGEKGTNNDAVIAKLTNNRVVCKILKSDSKSQLAQLVSANAQHLDTTPTAVPAEEVQEILGRVVRIIHNVNG